MFYAAEVFSDFFENITHALFEEAESGSTICSGLLTFLLPPLLENYIFNDPNVSYKS